jgi:glycine cleavage system H protein
VTALSQAVEALTLLVAGLLVRLGLVILVLATISGFVLLGLALWRQLTAAYDRVRGIRIANGVRWREGLLYTPGHTWLRPLRAGRLTLGLDDLAQRIFTGEPRIGLPEPGRRVAAGEPLLEITVDGRAAQIAAPITGTVLAVNERLREHPDLIHRDPYGRGWLVQIQDGEGKPANAREGEASRSWLSSEILRLERYVEWQLGIATADGGEPFLPPVRILEDGQWRFLVDSFLAFPPAPGKDTWGA